MITRFMQVMFSAAENNDEELTSQVANDIEDAKSQEEGSGVEDEEVSYINLGSGKVLVIDKENGEATVAEQNEDDPEQYDLEGFESDEQLEKYLHTLDGVTPNEDVDTEVTEDAFEDHDLPESEEWLDEVNNVEDYCPECGENPCVCDDDEDEDDDEEEENTAAEKVYSFPNHFARIFSEVLEEDEPTMVGDLKIEKVDDDTIIVTDTESGDEAQVTVNEDDEFEVNEVQKELCYSVTMTEDELALFSDILENPLYEVTMTEDELALFSELVEDDDEEDEDEDEVEEEEIDNDDEEDDDEEEYEEHKEIPAGDEEYEPLFVVGIDPVNHIMVDSPVYNEEDAQALADRLEEDGVEDIEIFDDPDEARDYAMSLLGEAGVSDIEQVAEPEEHNFSDVTIYTTRYFSDCTDFMFKLFSEAEDEITDSQDDIEEAIESGDQVETDDEIITPIDEETAIVADKENDEYTKVTLDGDEINTEKITEEEADELCQEYHDRKDEEEEEVKKYSEIIKFFDDIQEEQEQAEAQPVNPEEMNPETGDPVNVAPSAVPGQSVEMVEDKALAAVQSIQEAANEAVLAITEAKEAPAPGEEEDLREAKFSDYVDYEDLSGNTLATWLVQSI